MIATKNIGFKKLSQWTFHHFIWIIPMAALITVLYYFNILTFKIPWIAVSVIGTAVAFYVGFKNNQSYGRLWEARKIWGSIVNDSRTWGMMVDGYITNLFKNNKLSPKEIENIKQRLIYRHIGWLYTHRNQLLAPTAWEHINQRGVYGRTAKRYQKDFGIGLIDDEITPKSLQHFLPKEEYNRLINYANTATQIINEQSRDLRQLREDDVIDDFRHVAMENLLGSFYVHQGKNERIKKYPLPRLYANFSRYFVGIFVVLFPFSLVPEMLSMGSWGVWISIPIVTLVSWVFICMEIVGDYSENPFSGMANDIPMLSLCRVIEIDLLEMLGKTDLPSAVNAKNGILM
ncbi:MAG: bestrophin family protein [Aestuariibaculum sp.]